MPKLWKSQHQSRPSYGRVSTGGNVTHHTDTVADVPQDDGKHVAIVRGSPGRLVQVARGTSHTSFSGLRALACHRSELDEIVKVGAPPDIAVLEPDQVEPHARLLTKP